MPETLKNWLGVILLIVLALIPVVASATLTVFTGFSWAVLICGGLGVLAGRYFPTGPYGEGAFVVVWIWILLAIGIFVGLVTRLVLG